MLKRYIGPFEEVQVYVAGNDLGTVKKDEAIAVPDEIAALTEWPADNWQDSEAVAAIPMIPVSDNEEVAG